MIVAEIEPLVPRFVAPYFADYNERVVDSPKVTIQYDDARHFLLTTDRTFDVITSDMVDPWVKGTAALFTREFFDAARRRLKPGGVVTLFVQLYQSNIEAVKSELATFMEVFPNSAVWGNTINGEGYDLVVTGQVEPIRIDVDALQNRLTSPAYASVARSLREIGIASAVDLLSTLRRIGGGSGALAEGCGHQPRSAFAAAVSCRTRVAWRAAAAPIYAEMLRYASFPGRAVQRVSRVGAGGARRHRAGEASMSPANFAHGRRTIAAFAMRSRWRVLARTGRHARRRSRRRRGCLRCRRRFMASPSDGQLPLARRRRVGRQQLRRRSRPTSRPGPTPRTATRALCSTTCRAGGRSKTGCARPSRSARSRRPSSAAIATSWPGARARSRSWSSPGARDRSAPIAWWSIRPRSIPPG